MQQMPSAMVRKQRSCSSFEVLQKHALYIMCYAGSSPEYSRISPYADGVLKERTISDLDSVRKRSEAFGICLQEARNSKFDSWACPLCSYVLPEATFNPAYVTRQHMCAHGAAGRAVLRRSSCTSSAHKLAFSAIAKANVGKRLATYNADTEARHEMLNDALPSWACRYEHEGAVPGRVRSRGPFKCCRCEQLVSHKFRALRHARICPKADIAAQKCADKLSVAARRLAIEDTIRQSQVLDAERRSQRKREKNTLSSVLRRRKFAASRDDSDQLLDCTLRASSTRRVALCGTHPPVAYLSSVLVERGVGPCRS